MSNSEEETKKRVAEKLRLQLAQDRADLEERRLKNLMQQNDEQTSKLTPKEPVAAEFSLSPKKGGNLSLLDEYAKCGYKLGENGMLVFPSAEAAIKFFTDMASQGLSFLATRYENGKPVDDHVFSFGSGKLYKGTYTAIEEKLLDELKADPSNKMLAEGLKTFQSHMPSHSSDMKMKAELHESRDRERTRDQEKTSGDAPKPTPGPSGKTNPY